MRKVGPSKRNMARFQLVRAVRPAAGGVFVHDVGNGFGTGLALAERSRFGGEDGRLSLGPTAGLKRREEADCDYRKKDKAKPA